MTCPHCLDAYRLEQVLISDEPHYPCLPESLPAGVKDDGACYEHFLTPRKVARCSRVVETTGFESEAA